MVNIDLEWTKISLHRANIRVEGGEDDPPVASVSEDSFQNLVQEQIHLHRVLVFLPLVLHQLAVLYLQVKG